MKNPLTIGSRGSALARRQTDIVIEALRETAPDLQVETRIIRTEGDRRLDLSLDALGGQGVFVKDIERRLQAHEIDLAVHSLKDMPAETPPDLAIAAVLPRGDVRDALVARDAMRLDQLAAGARIGTDSRRRAVQLLALRPDVQTAGIRGNVDTRVAKVASGEYDAVVLAAAGLERLGQLDRAAQLFSVDEMLPAVGQAVLALQCRAGDEALLDLLRRIDHPPTRAAITAERAFLRRLGAGCRLPVGAYGQLNGATVRLRALLANDSNQIHRAEATAPLSDADHLGEDVAEHLMKQARIQ